jgi:predicted AlkP superfamily pyrophosphatase or phosphodiesterase
MPRVKALTTGSVPSFLDLILNFAESDTSSSLATQDTWLAQLRRRGEGRDDGKVVFYGDDTWLKLFPGGFFGRSEGTSSFFVSVSRHTSTRTSPVQSLAGKPLLARLAQRRPVDHIQAKYRSFFSCRISLKSTIT